MAQPLDSDEVRRAIRKFRPTQGRAGKEENYLLAVDGQFCGRITIPKGRKTLSWKTFRSACDQAGISTDQMRGAAQCRCGWNEFEALVRWKRAGAPPAAVPAGGVLGPC